MKYKNFKKLILAYKNLWDSLSELADMGFDLYGEGKYNLMNDIETMLYCQLRDSYTEEGVDWVSWFMFENEFGKKDWGKFLSYKRTEDGESELIYEEGEIRPGATDENGNSICYSIKSTWKFIKQYKK